MGGDGRPDMQDAVSDADARRFNRLDFRRVDPECLPEYGRGRVRNRYWDILPAPQNRVKLSVINDDEATEYINANYVKGANGNPRHYIAAQGPLPTTIHSFLRMIVEHRSSSVVMVTNLVEAGRKKCERYWPEQVGDTMEADDISVKLVSSEQDAGFVRNELEIAYNGKTHRTMHFWYNTWPDRGVPTKDGRHFTANVLKLVFAVRRHRGKTDKFRSPSVVHCSAGVGRTGCFVCIDQAFGAVERKRRVDLLDLIQENRQQRMAFVQTEVQYLFAHRAITEYARWFLSKGHKHLQEQRKRHTQDAAPNKRALASGGPGGPGASAAEDANDRLRRPSREELRGQFKREQHRQQALEAQRRVSSEKGDKQAAVEQAREHVQKEDATEKGSDAVDDMYVTTQAYDNPDNNVDALTFKAGEQMELVKKTQHWWHMRTCTDEGWVFPDMLIKKSTKQQQQQQERGQQHEGDGRVSSSSPALRGKRKTGRTHSSSSAINPFAPSAAGGGQGPARQRRARPISIASCSPSQGVSSPRNPFAASVQASASASNATASRAAGGGKAAATTATTLPAATAKATGANKGAAKKTKKLNPFSAFLGEDKAEQRREAPGHGRERLTFGEAMDMVTQLDKEEYQDELERMENRAHGVHPLGTQQRAERHERGHADKADKGHKKEEVTAAEGAAVALEPDRGPKSAGWIMDFVTELEQSREAKQKGAVRREHRTSSTSTTSNRDINASAALASSAQPAFRIERSDDEGDDEEEEAGADVAGVRHVQRAGETDVDGIEDTMPIKDEPQPFVSTLPPWTFVDRHGRVSQLCPVSSKHMVPQLKTVLLREPNQIQGPAIVSHDHSWRNPTTGAFAVERVAAADNDGNGEYAPTETEA